MNTHYGVDISYKINEKVGKTQETLINSINIDPENNTIDAESEINSNTTFETFFERNADFLKLSNMFQINGWETVLKNPYQNQNKFKTVIDMYLQKMLEV